MILWLIEFFAEILLVMCSRTSPASYGSTEMLSLMWTLNVTHNATPSKQKTTEKSTKYELFHYAFLSKE